MRIFTAFMICSFLTLVAVSGAMGQRVSSDLQVLYGFGEGPGSTVVNDVSGVGTPLNLNIADPGNVTWLVGNGLVIDTPTIIASAGPATKINTAVQGSHEITIEAWVAPQSLTQNGPARIVTCSADPYERNFTLGQGVYASNSDVYTVRLRTTATDLNGQPSLSTSSPSLTTDLTHVVYTRNQAGQTTIYLNGVSTATGTAGGDCSNWSDDYAFALGDEIGDARSWLGEYRLVAVYSRALNLGEVTQNWNAGPSLAPVAPTVTTHPASQTVVEGASATFSVTAVGTPPLSYEWFKNGSPLAASDSATFNTGPTSLADDGAEYYCVVTNDQGSDTSDSAFLSVLEFSGLTRIMPLGDSITFDNHGGTNPPVSERRAYRYPLYQLLKNAGYNVDFVGSQSVGCDFWPDCENEGHPGWTDSQIRDNIYNWLVATPADIILLHIGTNGLNADPAQVMEILDEIDAYEAFSGTPITVVLARIINRASSASLPAPDYVGTSSLTTTFNDNVITQALARPGDNIVVVDLENGVGIDYRAQPVGDMYDSLHPNDDGYAKMAWGFYEALQGLLPDPGVTCPAGMNHYWKMEKVVPTYVNQFGTLATTPLGFYDDPGGLFPVAPTQATGRVGFAQQFNGTGKYTSGHEINVADDGSLDWGPGDAFTLELWMKKDVGTLGGSGVEDNEVILGRDDGVTQQHWWLGVAATDGGRFCFRLSDNDFNGDAIYSDDPVDDGDWHHIAAVRDPAVGVNGTNLLYVDGVLQAQTLDVAYPAGFVADDVPLNVGWLNLSDGFYYNGLLDEVAIYNRALPDTEIGTHYAAGLGGLGYCVTGDIEPTITSVPVTSGYVDEVYSYDVNAVGNPAPTYELTVFPAGMLIDPVSGVITWTPTAAGAEDVTVRVHNTEGEDLQSFTITITVRPLCPNDMRAYWQFNESAGPSYMDVLNGHDASPVLGAPAGVAGQVDGAQHFDGADGLNVSSDPDFDFGLGDSFSLEYWVRVDPHDPPQNEVVIGRDDAATSLHWWTGLDDPAGVATFICIATDGSGSGSGDYLFGTTNLKDGLWHHVVAIREAGGTNRIYVDTDLEAETTVPYTAGFGGSTPLTIGWFNLSGNYEMEGDIDELAVYGRALDFSEIEAHYNNGLAHQGYCLEGPVAPEITSTPVTDGRVGELYTYDVDATGNPTPTYAIVSGPMGMDIDPATGIITWTPTSDGVVPVTVQAINTEGTADQLFDVAVTIPPLCPDEMTAYWKLEETSGNTYVDFYDQLDGQALVSAPTPFSPGVVGDCQSFDGSNYITVADDPALDWPADGSFTAELWCKFTNVSGQNKVMIGRDGGGGGQPHWWLGAWTTAADLGKPVFILNDVNGNGIYITGDAPINDDVWHHLVAVRDESLNQNRLYVDGGLAASGSHDYTADFGATTTMGIGYMAYAANPSYYYTGLLDEIALYGRALTVGEIEQHHTAGLAGQGYCSENAETALITSDPVTAGTVGELYTYDVNATGNPVPTYALVGSPPGDMAIDPVTGVINWTPTAIGDYDVTVAATNVVGTDTQPFTVHVVEPLVCPPGIVAYWKHDEAAGPTYFDAYNGHHAAPSLGAPTAVAGQVDGAQFFDGGDGLDVPAHADFDWGLGDSFSFAAWIKVEAHTPEQNEMIIGRDGGATSSLHWWLGLGQSPGVATFVCIDNNGDGYSGGADVLVGSTDLRDGQWHYVVVAREAGGTSKLYVDSDLEAQKTVNYTAGFEASTPLTIGWFNLSGNYEMTGAIDELAVYSRALATAEVEQQYLNGLQTYGYCEAFAPVIVSGAVLEATAAQAYEYDVDAAGHPAPTYALTTFPAGMVIDPASGLITWNPTVPASEDVVVTATNEHGTDTQSFTVVVTEPSPFPDCMVSWWRLDETTGPVHYDLVSGQDANVNLGDPLEVPGLPALGGGALEFDRVLDEVSVPDNDQYEWTGEDDFSIEFWMKNTFSGDNQVIVGRDDGPATPLHWWVGVLNGGTLYFGLHDNAGDSANVQGTADITDDVWHHVVAARDGGNDEIRLYLDGGMIDSKSINYAGDFSGNATLDIGFLTLGDHFRYNGQVDEIAIYCRVLDDAEILAHWNAGVGIEYSEPVAPVVMSVPVTVANIDQPYTYDVDATGVPTPDYALVDPPAGMTIDTATGVITWTPDAPGNFDVVIEANNTAGTGTQEFTINVPLPATCPDNMLAYLQLNETGGTTYQDSYDGHSGLASPAPPTPDPGGVVGGCQQFNGSNNYITVADHADLNWAFDASFTIELWAKFTDNTGNQVMIGRDGGGGGHPHWWLGAADGSATPLWYQLDTNGNGVSVSGPDAINDDEWHHLVAVRDEVLNENRLYVDGVLAAPAVSHDYTAGFETNTTLGIGYMAYNLNPGFYYDGLLDEIAIYDRALTLEEIQTHHTEGLAGMGYCEQSAYPLITSVAPTTATVGLPFTYDVEALGIPVPTFALTESPAGMDIDPASGVITFTPESADDFPVTVQATNTWGGDDQEFVLTSAYGAEPVISAITDIEYDEGGRVRISWHRSLFDAPGDGVVITEYGIYRMQDEYPPPVLKGAPAANKRLDGWDFIATVPARGDAIYQYVAPTLCDISSIPGMPECPSTFFISAMTPDPLEFYDSPAASGFSVDNLAPPLVAGFAVDYEAAGNQLGWQESEAADFHSFLVYRDWTSDFEPGPENLVASLRQTSWFDDLADQAGQPGQAFYRVAAQDSAGNIGEAALPGIAASVGEAPPTRFALHHNIPNPFNPLTTINYDLPRAARVSLRIYDVSGRLVRVLVAAKPTPPGRHKAVWNGRNQAGGTVAAGVYFYRLRAGDFEATRRMLLLK